MNHKELSELIERYAKANNLSHSDFAVGGSTAKYLLGDCLQYIAPINLAFRKSYTGQLPNEFEGHQFNCYRDHSEWSSYDHSCYSKAFVITTRHRLDGRCKK